jgi:hypothetical protein
MPLFNLLSTLLLVLTLGIVFLPLWLQLLLAILLPLFLWHFLRRRSRKVRLGASFLFAACIFGLLLPAIGVFQQTIVPNPLVTIGTSFEFHPTLDDERLRLECAALPFSGTGLGVTAIFTNPGADTLSYAVTQPSFYRWGDYFNYTNWSTSEVFKADRFIPVTLAPGTTQRLSLPFSPAMFGAMIFVEADRASGPTNQRDHPLVAFCSLLWNHRLASIVLGMLCALAALVIAFSNQQVQQSAGSD